MSKTTTIVSSCKTSKCKKCGHDFGKIFKNIKDVPERCPDCNRLIMTDNFQIT